MQKINVGFPIDLEKLIETRALIQANSGGGKSYLLRKIMEMADGKVPFIVIDLEGEFVTLRERHDIILFGKGHDIPINIQYAEQLATYLLELSASAIIDLSELERGHRILFVQRFLESMMDAPRKLWHPTLVFLDEAHIFCPEDGKAESMKAVIDLCTRGRKRGYCAILSTQRLAKLNKDAAAELNNKMIGRTTLDVDVKRTAAELGLNYNDAKQMLRQLEEGEFYVYGPAISQEVSKQKVSKVNTTHAKAGMKFSKITPPSKAIQHLISKIAEIPEETEKEKDTIKSLQEEIRQLKANSKNRPVNIVNQTLVLDLKKELAIHQQLLKQYESKLKAIAPQIEKMKSNTDSGYATVLKMIEEGKIKSPNRIDLTAAIIKIPSKEPVIKLPASQKPVLNHDEITDSKLGKCERAILTVLAQTGKTCNSVFIAIRSGYSVSGNFKNCMGKLRTLQFIEGYGESSITPAGLKALGEYTPLPEAGSELHQYWISNLGKCEGMILAHLISIHPNVATKEVIAQSIGYDVSGNFKNCLGKLRTLELIQGRGELKASDSLFE